MFISFFYSPSVFKKIYSSSATTLIRLLLGEKEKEQFLHITQIPTVILTRQKIIHIMNNTTFPSSSVCCTEFFSPHCSKWNFKILQNIYLVILGATLPWYFCWSFSCSIIIQNIFVLFFLFGGQKKKINPRFLSYHLTTNSNLLHS